MESVSDIELRLLLEAIYARYRHDFRHYTMPTLKRRVGQSLAHFGVRTLSALQERVLREPRTFRELLSFLTVRVSEMFRDPQVFRAIRDEVVPVLKTYPSVKVWVAGCSTGEEVYSLAIAFREEGLLDKTLMYATDIDPGALDAARRGIYADDRIAGFSRAYHAAGGGLSLSEYYTLAYGAAKFDTSLVRNVLFSEHSLATDEVFAEVQLVSCRNVLIYFDPELQERTIRLFKDSLVPRGLLVLGAKETLRFTPHVADFETLAGEQRIFQKI